MKSIMEPLAYLIKMLPVTLDITNIAVVFKERGCILDTNHFVVDKSHTNPPYSKKNYTETVPKSN